MIGGKYYIPLVPLIVEVIHRGKPLTHCRQAGLLIKYRLVTGRFKHF